MKALKSYRLGQYLNSAFSSATDGEPTGLFEDRFLSGFRPLMDMDNPSMKVSADLRVSILLLFDDEIEVSASFCNTWMDVFNYIET